MLIGPSYILVIDPTTCIVKPEYYTLCVHCHEPLKYHSLDLCLFSPNTFAYIYHSKCRGTVFINLYDSPACWCGVEIEL